MSNESIRLNVNLPREQMERLETLVPWGIRSALVRGLLEGFERAFHRDGFQVTGAIIAGQFNICLTGDGSDVSIVETTSEDSQRGSTNS